LSLKWRDIQLSEIDIKEMEIGHSSKTFNESKNDRFRNCGAFNNFEVYALKLGDG